MALAPRVRALVLELQNIEESELQAWCTRLSLGLAKSLSMFLSSMLCLPGPLDNLLHILVLLVGHQVTCRSCPGFLEGP